MRGRGAAGVTGEGEGNAWDVAYAGWLANGPATSAGSADEAPQMLRGGKKAAAPRLSVVTIASGEELSAEAPQMPREILF